MICDEHLRRSRLDALARLESRRDVWCLTEVRARELVFAIRDARDDLLERLEPEAIEQWAALLDLLAEVIAIEYAATLPDDLEAAA